MSWSVLQSASVAPTTGTGFGTETVTLGSNVSAGSTLLLFAQVNVDAGGIIAYDAQDSYGHAFHLIATSEDTFDSTVLAIFALSVNDAGIAGTTPTVRAYTNGNFAGGMLLQEVSGSSVFTDGTIAISSNLDGGTTISSAAYSSTASSEYLVAFYVDNSTVTWSTPSGWTADSHSVNGTGTAGNMAVFYKNSTGGAESVTIPRSAGDNVSQLALVAFSAPRATTSWSAFGPYGNGDSGVLGADFSSYGDIQLGLCFKLTEPGYQLDGYYYWCTAAETSTITLYGMCLFEDDNTTGTLVAGSKYLWSGSLAAGWNYLPLAAPIPLTMGQSYKVVSAGTGGFFYRNYAFGSGDTLVNGIINGPLFVFSDSSGGNPNPTGADQGTYGTYTETDPSANYPYAAYASGQPFIDVLITAVPASSGALMSVFP